MTKRVFIIHGWSGHPGEGWLLWLKNELISKGHSVFDPQMPDTDEPEIEKWVPFLNNLVGNADEQTYFVGHSIGCQTIIRYLEGTNEKVGGALFVAGWFDLIGLETEEEKVTAKPWIERPINFNKVKEATNNFLAILSTNDPVVELDKNKKIFEEKLGARVIVKKNAEHFNEIDEIPEILEFIK